MVGDADRSIYSLRAVYFMMLMGFQDDLGDQETDDCSSAMVKLDENYCSRATMLGAAYSVMFNNSEGIDKVPRLPVARGI